MDNIFNIITNLIVFVPIVVIFAILPSITRKDIVFGVTIPAAEWKNDYFTKLRKQYVTWAVIIGTILFAASIAATLLLSEQLSIVFMQGLMWAVLIIYFLLYIYFWKKTKKYKANANWDLETQNIAAADTSTDYRKRSVSNLWFLLYIVVIAVSYFAAVKLYDLAPHLIPMRYDLQGNPLVYAPKSMSIVYQLIGMQVFMAALFFVINITIRRAKKNIDPANPKRSSKQNDMMKYRWSIFLFITGLLMILIFAQILVAMFVTMPMWIIISMPFVITMFIVVYAVILSVKTGQSGNRIKVSDVDEEKKTITRDDDSVWKLGMFYYNKDDPSVFVEKRFGAGWTINHARWQSWLFIVGILALVAVSLILSF